MTGPFAPRETQFRRRATPEVCHGAYSLDAYCDHENPDHGYHEFPHNADGMVQTKAQAQRELRRRGWVFHDGGTATCPKCVRALKSRKGRA